MATANQRTIPIIKLKYNGAGTHNNMTADTADMPQGRASEPTLANWMHTTNEAKPADWFDLDDLDLSALFEPELAVAPVPAPEPVPEPAAPMPTPVPAPAPEPVPEPAAPMPTPAPAPAPEPVRESTPAPAPAPVPEPEPKLSKDVQQPGRVDDLRRAMLLMSEAPCPNVIEDERTLLSSLHLRTSSGHVAARVRGLTIIHFRPDVLFLTRSPGHAAAATLERDLVKKFGSVYRVHTVLVEPGVDDSVRLAMGFMLHKCGFATGMLAVVQEAASKCSSCTQMVLECMLQWGERDACMLAKSRLFDGLRAIKYRRAA